ncbi:MFS transporter [Planctomycetota bacterium]
MRPPTRVLNRNFVLLMQGQLVSVLGSQVFMVAQRFWILEQTGSATLMGTLSMLSLIPGVILSPIGGTFADQYSRKRILIVADILCGLAVLSLAVMLWWVPESTYLITIWLMLVAVIVGTCSAFFSPAISAAVPDLVPKEKLNQANSATQASAQLCRMVGQGLGGWLFLHLGATLMFLIDGVSYLFSAGSETLIVIPQKIPEKAATWKDEFDRVKKDMMVGLRYVWQTTGLRALVLAAAFMNFFLMPVGVLMPFYVVDELGLGADWFGYLLAAEAVGLLVGSIAAGVINISGATKSRIFVILLCALGIFIVLLGLVWKPKDALITMMCTGVLVGIISIYIGVAIQGHTPSEIRGRVFGVLGLVCGGLMPISAGLAGVIADLTGQNIPLIYMVCGGLVTVACIALSTSKAFRDYLAYEPEPDNKSEEDSSGNENRDES